MASLINVLLVDDHFILREGVKTLIESDPEVKVVACAATAEEAVARALSFEIDVALIDYSLPDHDGVWVLERIHADKPGLPVLLLSMHTDRDIVVRVLNEGASGYLPKSVDASELLTAIRSVHQGGSYLHPTIAPHLLGALRDSSKELSSFELNERELHILQRAADGWSNQRIADELFLSISTVKADLRELFRKLNVASRTEAVAEAIRRGSIPAKSSGRSPSES